MISDHGHSLGEDHDQACSFFSPCFLFPFLDERGSWYGWREEWEGMRGHGQLRDEGLGNKRVLSLCVCT